MKALHQPNRNAIQWLAGILCTALTAPALAMTAKPKIKPTAPKNAMVQSKMRQPSAVPQTALTPAPLPRVAVETTPQQRPAAGLPAPAEKDSTPRPGVAAAAAIPGAIAPTVAVLTAALPAAAPTATAQNPYLAGWYRPVPAAALPAMAVGQLNANVRYVSDAVASIPAKFADVLPSIKTVHPTGGRDLVVANLKCPAEMITGQYFIPANAMREGINGLFNKLNDAQVLKFDIQLVCS